MSVARMTWNTYRRVPNVTLLFAGSLLNARQFYELSRQRMHWHMCVLVRRCSLVCVLTHTCFFNCMHQDKSRQCMEFIKI